MNRYLNSLITKFLWENVHVSKNFCNFDFVEDTSARKSPNNILLFARLFVSLQEKSKTRRYGKEQKIYLGKSPERAHEGSKRYC